MNSVIDTIGRQFGSGGRAIGKCNSSRLEADQAADVMIQYAKAVKGGNL